MIVSISGRKKSGKTTLASVLKEKGFIQVSFADELKSLLCQLYGWELRQLTSQKYKERKLKEPAIWNEESAKKLKQLIGARKRLNCEPQVFNTCRDAMQYVGTEVLREYDQNFHIKAFEKRLDPKKNYVCDDLRYRNEHELFKKLGGLCIYIVRPYNKVFSNHQSEIDLKRSDFDNVILNDGTKSEFTKNFRKFFKYTTEKTYNRKEILGILEASNWDIEAVALQLNCNKAKAKEILHNLLIHYPDKEYNGLFLKKNKESLFWYNEIIQHGKINKKFSIEYSDKIKGFMNYIGYEKEVKGNKLVINSPWMIEDLKAFM